jgi:acetolactate synthase-1/3 small subunit
MEYTNQSHVISLYVANKPGVLNRISLVFSRRGFNIDSLVVSESQDPRYSTMTMTAVGSKNVLIQILKQLNKLVDVIHAKEYTDSNVIKREMGLMKLNCSPEQRTEVLQIAQAFRAETMDLTHDSLTLECKGSPEKLDTLEEMLNPFGLIEVVRTGTVLMARGAEQTSFN